MNPKTIVVIPARMASTRYPGKPLANIMGLPMIEHVRRRALLAKNMEQVVIATCDQEIMDFVAQTQGLAVMTSPEHERSSERVAEAMKSLSGEVVVVAQGDEPLLIPQDIELVSAPFRENKEIQCASLLSPLESEQDFDNPNIVKAACNQNDEVFYLSRAPIPFQMKPGGFPVYRETGIRAFRADFLQTYVSLPETPLEKVETVDMLRVLEHGYHIQGVLTEFPTFGVDHVEDVAIIEEILRTDADQKALFGRIMKEHP